MLCSRYICGDSKFWIFWYVLKL